MTRVSRARNESPLNCDVKLFDGTQVRDSFGDSLSPNESSYLTERVAHCVRLVDYNMTHHNLTATRSVRDLSARLVPTTRARLVDYNITLNHNLTATRSMRDSSARLVRRLVVAERVKLFDGTSLALGPLSS